MLLEVTCLVIYNKESHFDLTDQKMEENDLLYKILSTDEMVYEMDHIWTADMKSSEAMIFAMIFTWYCQLFRLCGSTCVEEHHNCRSHLPLFRFYEKQTNYNVKI